MREYCFVSLINKADYSKDSYIPSNKINMLHQIKVFKLVRVRVFTATDVTYPFTGHNAAARDEIKP